MKDGGWFMGQYGRQGAFGAGPPAYISNSSPSQVRFNESTPMSQSYDLLYEGSQKCHPHALGFDDLICSLRRLDIVSVILLQKSVAHTFEGLSTEGVKLNLAVGVLCESSDSACLRVVGRPVGPFEAWSLHLDSRERFLPCI
jgi:hypothetical protein